MKGKSHLSCGIIAGTGCAVIGLKTFPDMTITDAVSFVTCCTFASLLPDIDMPNSMFGKKLIAIPKIINKIFGHRTVTHAFFWAIPLAALTVEYSENPAFFIFSGFLLGFLSHILSDTFTAGGVPWAWPLSKKRYHLTNINSGEKDFLFAAASDAILIGSCFLIAKYFF